MDDEEKEKPEWAVGGADDECDALNDETFGGGGEEYTWENSQSMFEDLHKVTHDLTRSNGASNGYSKSSVQVPDTPEIAHDARPKETEYYDYDNDNALEESISRLVLDDFEDMDDEDEARKMKLSRLGAASNFNTYFLPPQVASKHHWLMEKELPGGSSLLGSSVWSMHPTTAPAPAPIVDNSLPISRPVGTPHRTVPTQPINSMIKHLSDSPVSENNISKMFAGVPSSTPKNASVSKNPVFKTVEEIERELLEGTSQQVTPRISSSSVNNLSPQMQGKPRMLMAEDLERELIQDSPMQTPRNSEFDVTMRSPLQSLSQLNQLFHPEPPHAQQNQGQQKLTQTQQPFNSPHSNNATNMGPSANTHFNNMSTGPAMMNNTTLNSLLMMEQQKQLLLARQGLLPTPNHPVLHPGMLPPGGPIPPQLAQGFHPGLSPMQQQQHMRMLQLNPHMRARMPMMMPMPHGVPPNRPHHPQMGFMPHPHMSSGFRKQMKTDDPYRGLMTEKDKQRLRNIQIIQLQNDHPFTTDYYSLMHKVKHNPPSGENVPKRQYLVKLYPKRDDDNIHKNHYEPARFENSLGKLQAVSALAPKRVIDTVIRVTECRNAPRGGIKAYRYLLLEIEKLYESLLRMEEADIRVAILCNADNDDIQKRSQNAERISKILMNNEKLLSVLAVQKGKMLICRVLPLTEYPLRIKILGHLLNMFPMWGTEDMDKAFPYLRHCILHSDVRDLLTIIGSVSDNSIFESIVMTKLGTSILTCVFHQAENLLSDCDPLLLEDLESHWTRKSVYGILAILVKHENLANPIEVYPNILQHIRRFALHGTDFQVLESILQRWVGSGVPVRQQC